MVLLRDIMVWARFLVVVVFAAGDMHRFWNGDGAETGSVGGAWARGGGNVEEGWGEEIHSSVRPNRR